MKKLIILLLTLTLILGVFASCQKRYLTIDDETSSSPSEDTSTESTTGYITESNETTQTENTETDDRSTEITDPIDSDANKYTYTVEKIDGKYYMVFDNYWAGSGNPFIGYSVVYVNSLYDLKYEIPQGNLGEAKSLFIRKYVHEHNYTQVPIYDIEHIWQPTLPDSFPAVHPDMIALRPGSYSFQAWYVEHPEWLGISSPAYTIEVLSKESYESSYESTDQRLISNGWSKKELQDGDKMLTVYSFSGESDHEEGVILHAYTIYATNGQYYGTIHTALDHELTDEELLEFGFEEYLG